MLLYRYYYFYSTILLGLLQLVYVQLARHNLCYCIWRELLHDTCTYERTYKYVHLSSVIYTWPCSLEKFGAKKEVNAWQYTRIRVSLLVDREFAFLQLLHLSLFNYLGYFYCRGFSVSWSSRIGWISRQIITIILSCVYVYFTTAKLVWIIQTRKEDSCCCCMRERARERKSNRINSASESAIDGLRRFRTYPVCLVCTM